MLCERCQKKEATFYYHENENGKQKTYRLCSDCAAEMEKSGEINVFDGEKLFDSFGSFFEDFENPFKAFENPFKSFDKMLSSCFGWGNGLPDAHSVSEEKKCPTCGMTLREFAENGMAGCPDCYKAFEKELEPTISRVQGKNEHIGRAPARLREKLDNKKKIEALEKEQKEAVRHENYERAAEIRDELKKLRGE